MTDTIKIKTDKGVETRTFKFRKTHHGPSSQCATEIR